MTSPVATSLQLLRNFTITGYLPGWQQPLTIVELTLRRDYDAAAGLVALHATLTTALPDLLLPSPPVTATLLQLGHYLLDCLQALLVKAQYLQLAPPHCEIVAQADGTPCLVLKVPSLGPLHSSLNATTELLARMAITPDPANDTQRLKQILRFLNEQRPSPGLGARLLQAAVAAGIPWLHINLNVYQFGWGRAACLFESSFTERTSNIGTRLARHKFQAAQVLRGAGLPVPPHELVNSLQHAEGAAARLGYPVVVKPADLDKGIGVAANLKQPAAVVAAYHAARKHSARILVEKHIAGRDYRVVVLDGKVITVIERIPGGVIGDGRRDIKALLDEVNSDPLRQPAASRRAKIALDEEALSLLAEQHLQVDSVPAAGLSVLLRRTANVATGGTPIFLTLDQIHPDNALVCIRAAAALRLDLAGVDFLTPDITKSWRTAGGGICEVNAQPQVQPELPAYILQQRVTNQGRIPVVTIMAPATQSWWCEVEAALVQRGITLGVADCNGVRLGGVTIADPTNVARAAGMLLREPTLAAAIFIVSAPAQLREGAPVDKLDLLVVATTAPPQKMLQLLQPRAAALWCIDSSVAAPQHDGVTPAVTAPESLASALLAFLEARL